ncbi:cellulose synthase [Neorhizobium sp. NCHU2750]|uniref:cellulose synthase n=1 Tax=Neorhizobium sp. NCHU2750 TaxID=1825976 RepID=UPI000E759305|nr:cellulose synthesis protein [Neorhizobium sp. NCHU2750]
MRFSLISLAAFGVAVAAIVVFERRPAVDFNDVTGSLTATGPASAADFSADAERTGRLSASAPDQKYARAPLVVAQAQPSAAAGSTQPSEIAQAAPPASQAAGSAVPAAGNSSSAAPQVDESALRYFAARGDTARLQAEISRLRALYPNWTPPTDPLAIRPTTDPQLENMWQLYAQSRYADVRKAIADRQASEPNWQPPADLLDRLKLAEARSQLTAASDAKTYDEVIRIAAENPTLLTCSEVDVLWRLAEAFADTDRKARARDAYLYILSNCSGAPERLATVQKASQLLPPDMIDQLLAKERTGADGKPEFDSLRDDLARRMVGDGNTDPKLVVPAAYLTRLENLAEKGDLASDSLLLGWYYYRRDNLGGAERWFRKAFTKEETASAAQGLALTLTRQNSPLEAESVLYKWRDDSPGTKAAYMAAVANLLAIDPPPILQEQVLGRMATAVMEAKDAAAAQQFGWYARYMHQPATAAQWFAAALSWKPDDEPSAYGLVLSRNDLGDKTGVAAIQRVWGGRSERIANLGEDDNRRGRPGQSSVAQNYVAQIDGPQATRQPVQPIQPQAYVRETAPRLPDAYAPTPVQRAAPRVLRAAPAVPVARGCSTTIDPRFLSPEQALTRGWCLMDLNRPLEAVQAFDAASLASAPAARSDAAYGKSLAYLRAGLTDKAAAAATTAPQNNTRAVELQSAILSNRAVSAFKAGRYQEALIALDQRAQIVPEQTDLMSLRGYAYLRAGRRADAMRIFEALANLGNRDGLRALADLTTPGH